MTDTAPSDSGDAQFNLSITIGWITFADTKATILLTLSFALLGVSLTDIPALARVSIVCIEGKSYWFFGVLLAVHLAFYLMLLRSIWHFADVVRPKLIPSSEKHSWYFFQSMALLSPSDFHAFTASLTPESKLTQLNDQIYNNSVVARKKYATIANGIRYLIIASVLALLAIVPVLIAEAILPKT